MSEEIVLRILKKHPALIGKELRDISGLEELPLWRLCSSSEKFIIKRAGKRYLRLDRNVEGYARLSPSIKREFLTYTVCGLSCNRREIESRAVSLEEGIRNISRKKRDLALSVIKKVVHDQEAAKIIERNICFILAGDIVFEMAHLEPRPERSTGKLVQGSDLDIIIICKDGFDEDILKKLDKSLYTEKYLSLIRPEIREEIDYIIKDMSRVREQLRFDRFEFMVAAKILWEGEFLFGSRPMFEEIKRLLDAFHIPERIVRLEEEAVRNRTAAEETLKNRNGTLSDESSLKLFFTKEESDEIF
jgi:hypothetical protein